MTKTGQLTGAKSRDFIEKAGAVGIFEFCKQTGYSYHHVYEQIRIGKLPASKQRGVWLIPRAVLEMALRGLVPVEDSKDE